MVDEIKPVNVNGNSPNNEPKKKNGSLNGRSVSWIDPMDKVQFGQQLLALTAFLILNISSGGSFGMAMEAGLPVFGVMAGDQLFNFMTNSPKTKVKKAEFYSLADLAKFIPVFIKVL